MTKEIKSLAKEIKGTINKLNKHFDSILLKENSNLESVKKILDNLGYTHKSLKYESKKHDIKKHYIKKHYIKKHDSKKYDIKKYCIKKHDSKKYDIKKYDIKKYDIKKDELNDLKNKIGLYIFQTENITKDNWNDFMEKLNPEKDKNGHMIKTNKIPDWNKGKPLKENVLYVGSSKTTESRLTNHIFKCSINTYALKLYEYEKYTKESSNHNFKYTVDVFYLNDISKNEYEYIILNNSIERILHEILEPVIGTSR